MCQHVSVTKRYQLLAVLIGLVTTNAVSAATVVDLSHQPISYLKPYFASQRGLTAGQLKFTRVRDDIDFNQTAHIRLQQTYAGYPIWDATSVVHIPHATNNSDMFANADHTKINGLMYVGVEKDIANTSNDVLSESQKARALQSVTALNEQQKSIKTIIYIDEHHQAHYAFLISFFVDDGETGAHRPTVIMGADSFQIYRSWDQVLTKKSNNTEAIMLVTGGGIGGNEKIGETVYDGDIAQGYLTGFTMLYNPSFSTCTLENDDIVVQDVAYGDGPVSQQCYASQDKHNNVYWLDWDNDETRWKDDEANGGYSPSLDALYSAVVVKKMYQDWYGVPVLTEEDGKTPMKLIMRVHYGRNFDNAFWDGHQMTFGDGGVKFYSLASLDVGAHEISHGFTMQHSNIDITQMQTLALHESFSDMAAIAVQFYLTGKNRWDMGHNIMKNDDALRYLDDPKKDGHSIDNMKYFNNDMDDPHLIAGIFNKAFYLIATSKGWDTHTAFNIMVKANMHYWTSSMQTLTEAACGVLSATKDYNYNISDVSAAFSAVGIDTNGCEVH